MFKCLIVLLVPNFIYSYTYPVFGTKRYGRSGPVHRSAYIPVPIPVARRYTEYQVPEYDEGYLAPSQPEEYEYNTYDKYPFVSYYGYYPRDYYHEKSDRRNVDNYGYFEEQAPNDPIDDLQEEMMQDDRKDDAYPYGQETWFEGGNPKYENNAEANAAFLQNLIIAQMYQDAAASAAVNAGNPSRYAAAFPSFVYAPVVPNEDYDDKNWLYGVPTTGLDEKEKAQQYFKKEEDEEVKELESLRKKNKQKQNKQKGEGKKNKNKNKNKNQKNEQTEISNDEFLAEMQQQNRRNNRKNYQEGEILINKKNLNPTDVKYDSWNLGKVSLKNYPDSPKEGLGKLVTSKPLKMNGYNFSDRKNRIEVPTTIAATTTTTSKPSTTTTERPISFGQKEVVLPRPANPVRRPYSEKMSLRSPHQPSVYDTIKQLLSMEEDVRQDDIGRPQKRFVLSEDQLTAELNGLKKLAA